MKISKYERSYLFIKLFGATFVLYIILRTVISVFMDIVVRQQPIDFSNLANISTGVVFALI